MYGLASPRVFLEEKLIGYDGLDLSSHVRFPLVRLKEAVEGPDWFHFGGLRYDPSPSKFPAQVILIGVLRSWLVAPPSVFPLAIT